MAFKAVLLCVSALLVQYISGQCANRVIAPSCGCSSGNRLSSGNLLSSGSILSSGLSSSELNNGGGFIVQSYGPITPTGIATVTDLNLAAELGVCGTVPFLSAVAFDGTLPTSGSGCVDYGCGDGCIGITSVTGGSNLGGLNIRNSGCGCGCN